MTTRIYILLAALLAAPLGCSDDTSPADAFVVPDVTPLDASVDSGDSGQDGGVEAGSGLDLAADAAAIPCDPKCAASAPYKCAFASGTSSCVECLVDSHCSMNPATAGTRCHATGKWCYCAADADCAGKWGGSSCVYTGTCGCGGDADCSGGRLCHGIRGAARVCADPCSKPADCPVEAPSCDATSGRCRACKQDSDCTKTSAPLCDAASGRCVACKQDSDCTLPTAQRCEVSVGRCVRCTADAQCATHLDGPSCTTAWLQCGCTGASQCGPTTAGAQCIADGVFAGWSHCGCVAPADCVNNASGSVCQAQLGRCSCTTDADCKQGTCKPDAPGSTLKRCQ